MKDPLNPALLASLCHDLRGPLGAMGTWIHVLSSGKARPEIQTQALSSMAADVRALGGLIEQLSALSTVLSGPGSVQPEVVNLTPLIESACAASARDSDFQVSFQTNEPMLKVKADKGMITQLMNLFVSRSLTGRPGASQIRVRVDGSVAFIVVETTGAAPRSLSVALAQALCEAQGGSLDADMLGKSGITARFPVAL